jgi:hypothetical protein
MKDAIAVVVNMAAIRGCCPNMHARADIIFVYDLSRNGVGL